MNHDEAVEDMATQRYLLDELSAGEKDSFEEHMFDCQECAMDVRAAMAFLNEAKAQLPQMTAATAEAKEPVAALHGEEREPKTPWWSRRAIPVLRPALTMPAFAVLLGVIAYQNFSTIPSLRSAATQPRIVPWNSLRIETRGGESIVVQADRRQGAVVLIVVSQQPAYASYVVDLYDLQGRRFWTQTVIAAGDNNGGAETLSLLIPGGGLHQGQYTLNLAGISPQGARTELGRRVLDVHFRE
jgi:anti-sigma factor RsiW